MLGWAEFRRFTPEKVSLADSTDVQRQVQRARAWLANLGVLPPLQLFVISGSAQVPVTSEVSPMFPLVEHQVYPAIHPPRHCFPLPS